MESPRNVVPVALFAATLFAACGGEEPARTCPFDTVPSGDECIAFESDGSVDDAGSDSGLEVLPMPDGGTFVPDAGPPPPDCTAPERCDGVDQDCDGLIDEGALLVFHPDRDLDGFGDGTAPLASCGAPSGWIPDGSDCNDERSDCHPGATELCDSVNQDCDEDVDEDLDITFYVDADGDGFGTDEVTYACSRPDGFAEASGDCNDAAAAVHPGATETCDARDEDCDSMRDETFACVSGAPVSCVTSCGSAGTGTCRAGTCTAPSASACTPPAESCNGRDDDCDGSSDELSLAFGTLRDLGGGSGRIDIFPTATGFVSVYVRAGALVARRLDAMGAPLGSEVTIAPGTVDFGAAVSGDSLVVGWISLPDLRGIVLRTSDLSVATAARAITTISDFTDRVRVVARPSGALFFHHDGGLRATARALPGLTGTSAPAVVATVSDPGFAVTSDGTTVYVTHGASARLQLDTYTFGGVRLAPRLTLTTADGLGTDHRDPAIVFATTADGTRRIGVAFARDATSASGDRLRLAVVDVSLDGSLTLRDSVDAAVMGNVPPGLAGAIAITYAGNYFQIAALAGTAASNLWAVADVLIGAGAPTVGAVSVEGARSVANRGVAIAPSRTGVLVAASQLAPGNARVTMRGCP